MPAQTTKSAKFSNYGLGHGMFRALEEHLGKIGLNPKEFKKIDLCIGATFNQEIEDLRNEKKRLQLKLLGIDQETIQVFKLLGDDMNNARLTMVKEKITSLAEEKNNLQTRLFTIEGSKESTSNSKKAIVDPRLR